MARRRMESPAFKPSKRTQSGAGAEWGLAFCRGGYRQFRGQDLPGSQPERNDDHDGVAATALGRDPLGNIYALAPNGVFKWNAATRQTTQILSDTGSGMWVDEFGDVYLANSTTGIQKYNTGAPWCALGASYLTAGSAGGSNTVTIHFAAYTPAAWTASTTSSWLHITTATGKGPGTILFTVDANPGAAPRSGTIAIDSGLQMVVTQAGTNYTGVQEITTLIPSVAAKGLAADFAGNLYLANNALNVIDQWSASTQQLTPSFVETGNHAPSYVALDEAGNLFFSDTSPNTIQGWTASTNQLTTVVSGANPLRGVAVDHQGEVAYAVTVTAINTQQVNVRDPGTGAVTVQSNLAGAPYGVASDPSGSIYYTDPVNNAVHKISRVTKPLDTTVISTGLNSPYGIAVDGSGNIYIGDRDSAIKKWTAATGTLTTLGPAQVGYGLAVDGAGNVYATSGGTSVIKRTSAFVSAPGSESGAGGTDSLMVLPQLDAAQWRLRANERPILAHDYVGGKRDRWIFIRAQRIRRGTHRPHYCPGAGGYSHSGCGCGDAG
jgi:hypothetical protein